MGKIIILTNNILSELKLEESLINLGYEVYCSSQVLENILLGLRTDFALLFDIAIISPTVSDEATEKILEKKYRDIKFFRIDNFDEELEAESEKRPSVTYINENCSQKALREILSCNVNDGGEVSSCPSQSSFVLDKLVYENFVNSLSTKEVIVFNILTSLNGTFIERKELATRVWGGCNSSNLAQLSQIISRIKQKMFAQHIDDSCLITNWRKGYALSDLFLEEIQPEKRLSNQITH